MNDADIGKKQPDPDDDIEAVSGNEGCMPYGAAITNLKPYWYIVQPEDIASFWLIPTKFNLPTKAGTAWTWQELRNANMDWKGGFTKVGAACVLASLFPGARLHVPAEWPEPKPGVQIEKKAPGTPGASSLGNMKVALIVAAVGVAGIGGLAWLAYKDKNRNRR